MEEVAEYQPEKRKLVKSCASDLVFRVARPEQVNAVASIVRGAFAKWINTLGGREPSPMRLDFGLAVAKGEMIVAVCQGEIVAVARLLRQNFILFIDVVAVRPDLQRLGIGSALLREIETIASREGFRLIQLKTVALYFQNIPFYGKNGFLATQSSDFEGTPIYDFEKQVCALWNT